MLFQHAVIYECDELARMLIASNQNEPLITELPHEHFSPLVLASIYRPNDVPFIRSEAKKRGLTHVEEEFRALCSNIASEIQKESNLSPEELQTPIFRAVLGIDKLCKAVIVESHK